MSTTMLDYDRLKQQLIELMGGLPERAPLQAETAQRWTREDHFVEYITYNGDAGERIPAYLLVPADIDQPRPAIVALHQHAGQFEMGKSEVAGMTGDPDQAIGNILVEAGYVVLAPDTLAFEQRRGRVQQGAYYERYVAMRELLYGRTLTAKYVADASRAVDYLVSRPEVDADRLGVVGHSMGGTGTVFAAALDERFQAAFSNCGVCTYQAILRDEVIHNFMLYVPGLLNLCDMGDIIALTAPRAFMISSGAHDPIFPADGIRQAYHTARDRYEQLGADDKIDLLLMPCDHQFNPTMRQACLRWFAHWLDWQYEE